jgi:hypothetical protein
MARSRFPHVRKLHVQTTWRGLGENRTFAIPRTNRANRTSQAMSLLGFLTVALFPVPILFFIYGARIRKKSKFTS